MNVSEFRVHRLWAELDRARVALTSADSLADSNLSQRLDDARQVLAVTQTFFETDDLFLFSPVMLEEAATGWSNFNAYMEGYVGNPASYPTFIDVAIDAVDQVRDALARFPKPQTSANKHALNRAVKEQLDILTASREALIKILDDSQRAAEEREVALQQRIEALATESANLTGQLAALDARIAKDEVRLDSALTTTNETFIAAQSARETAYLEWLSAREDDFSAEAEPYLGTLRTAEKEARLALDKVNALRTSVVDMANIASGDILAGEYGTSAKSERTSAWVGYGVGAAAGIASILIILFAFGAFNSALSWPQVILKLGLTAATGGLAAVAFRFGGQALGRATSFRRQELELRSLQPFLSGVDKADEAKISFISRSFGHSWVGATKAPDLDAAQTGDVIKMLTTIVERLPKT